MSSQLWMKPLPPQFTIRGYITGDESICDYELYLTEFINHSSHLLERFDSKFVRVDEQSHGEPDVVNRNYGLDFKLLDSQSSLESRSVLKSQITKHPDGWTAYSKSKQDREMKITRIHAALRFLQISDFENGFITIDDYQIRKDLNHFRRILLTEKNILLFFPFKLYHDPKLDNPTAIFPEVLSLLNNDFKTAFRFRSLMLPDFETYFSTVYEDYYVLANVDNESLVLVDLIPVGVSSIWQKLLDYEIMGEL